MFWSARSSLDADDEEWQLASWDYLLRNLGGRKSVRAHKLALPRYNDFPRSSLTGEARAREVFEQVASRMGVDADGFELSPQEPEIEAKLGPLAVVTNAPSGPAGTYRVSLDNKEKITYSPALLGDLEGLIATFAHEICHSILIRLAEEPPGGWDNEEFLTDLAVAFHGFGVFAGNSAFRFNQYVDHGTGTQGWGYRTQGYLSQSEWSFALAVRTIIADDSQEEIEAHCASGLLTFYKRNLKYLRKRPEVLSSIIAAAVS
jgi:hypothetical protein